jgi:hypothetical protein
MEDLLDGGRPTARAAMLEALSPNAREDYFLLREHPATGPAGAKMGLAVEA